MRAVYKSRHDTLLEAMKPFRKILTVSGENAGVHLLLNFHNGMTEQEAADRAWTKGVKVYGLSRYYVGGVSQERQTVILGYANVTEDAIKEAAGRLAQAWL